MKIDLIPIFHARPAVRAARAAQAAIVLRDSRSSRSRLASASTQPCFSVFYAVLMAALAVSRSRSARLDLDESQDARAGADLGVR
jgi:hypothetical protein